MGNLLSIIIPIWNVTADLARMTERHLDLLHERTQVAHEVIVIDNGSPHRRPYNVQVQECWAENRGLAPAWNRGVALSQGDVLCFLNNDVEVLPNWDTRLLQAISETGVPRIVFPYTDAGAGPQRPDGGFCGWCFMVSRSLYDRIGPFDEKFVPAFYEDTDFFHRAWEQQIQLHVVPEAVVKHQKRTTARYLPVMDMTFKLNRLRYAKKHGLQVHANPPFAILEDLDA